MDSINPKFARYGGTNACARTNALLLPLSDVSTRAVSLSLLLGTGMQSATEGLPEES